MPIIPRSIGDILAKLKALLPTGVVWPRDPDADLSKAVGGPATTVQRVRARAEEALTDAFPGTTFALLPEWEATLGLPDPCSGLAPTVAARRAQVVTRFAVEGGQSRAYFIGVAAALGYPITITEFAPARFNDFRMGMPMNGAEWAHVWAVNAPLQTAIPFRLGTSVLGERFLAFGNAVLECTLSRLKPAHTTLFFQYT